MNPRIRFLFLVEENDPLPERFKHRSVFVVAKSVVVSVRR